MDVDEINRRIIAARTLRKLTQRDLDALGERDGLGRQELSRVERGELALTRVRRETLIRLLRLPTDWFTAETVDDLLHHEPTQLDRIESNVNRLELYLREGASEAVRRRVAEAAQQQTRHPGTTREDQVAEDG